VLLLDRIKVAANKRDVSCPSLIKMWLFENVGSVRWLRQGGQAAIFG